MSEYRQIKGRGGVRYMKNNRLVSIKDVPEDVLQQLTEDNVVGEQGVKPTPNAKACIFCGMWGNYSKFINLRTIALCQEHYHSKTTGEIAQQLRERTP